MPDTQRLPYQKKCLNIFASSHIDALKVKTKQNEKEKKLKEGHLYRDRHVYSL